MASTVIYGAGLSQAERRILLSTLIAPGLRTAIGTDEDAPALALAAAAVYDGRAAVVESSYGAWHEARLFRLMTDKWTLDRLPVADRGAAVALARQERDAAYGRLLDALASQGELADHPDAWRAIRADGAAFEAAAVAAANARDVLDRDLGRDTVLLQPSRDLRDAVRDAATAFDAIGLPWLGAALRLARGEVDRVGASRDARTLLTLGGTIATWRQLALAAPVPLPEAHRMDFRGEAAPLPPYTVREAVAVLLAEAGFVAATLGASTGEPTHEPNGAPRGRPPRDPRSKKERVRTYVIEHPTQEEFEPKSLERDVNAALGLGDRKDKRYIKGVKRILNEIANEKNSDLIRVNSDGRKFRRTRRAEKSGK